MRARVHGLGGALLVAVTSWLSGPTDQDPERGDPERPEVATARDATCAVCHPGAVEGLRLSVHAPLLRDPALEDRACTTCHGDVSEHVASARRPEATLLPAGPVSAASCVACHGETDWPASAAAHPWQPRRGGEREPPPTIVLPEPSGLDAFDWSGLLAAGYRFVSTSGSSERFRTDVDLEPGLRLVEARLTGVGRSRFVDRIDLRAEDVGDPFTRFSAELEKRDRYRASGGYSERVFRFLGSGEFSRVEHRQRETTAALDVDLTDSLGLWADYTHFEDRGRWLVRRIGDLGVTPLRPIGDVSRPRSLEADEIAAGLRGTLAGVSWRIGVDWLDEEYSEHWSFTRPLPGPDPRSESEDFRSASDIEGPGTLVSLSRAFGPIELDFDARHRDLERNVAASGSRTGFTPSEFVTDTESDAVGDARTTWLDLGLVADLGERVALYGDVRYRDHEEEMRLDQVEMTRFSAGGSIVATDQRDLRTAQRRLSGSIELEVEVLDDLIVSGGWGFSREDLRLPLLAPSSTDPTGGTLEDDGAIAALRWQPFDAWTLSARYTDFGQSGLFLHERQEDEARTATVSLRYAEESLSGEVFARHRRSANDFASHRSERNSYGLNATWTPSEGLDLFGSYVFAETDSRTLTNFFFDPDPTPVPTVVGFTGNTHIGTLGVGWEPADRLAWRNDFVWARTTGDFAVRTVTWRSDLQFRVTGSGRAGLRYDLIDYGDSTGTDDYHADLVLVYWAQSIGGG